MWYEYETNDDIDGDGVSNEDDIDPYDANIKYDSDGDGVADSKDAFPNDKAASIDSNKDGLPDSWNSGYSSSDSTTGLSLTEQETTSCSVSQKLENGKCVEKTCEEDGYNCSSDSGSGSNDDFTYSTITSSVTGKVWMDRNLGASRACTSYDDEDCYGDYYQWGRDADGHEKSDSSETSIISSSTTPEHSSFITTSSSYNYDWITADSDGTTRSTNWNPCPSGYRIPTKEELEAENIQDREDAFSKLKLPYSGVRRYYNGDIENQGSFGYLWTITENSSDSWIINYNSSNAFLDSNKRGNGFSVRCIEDTTSSSSDSSTSASTVYQEDFSSNPNYTSVSTTGKAEWNEGGEYYRVETRDNENDKYWAYSPQFSELDMNDNFTIELDLFFEYQDWGTYPGVFFYGDEPTEYFLDENKFLSLRIQDVYTDTVYKKIGVSSLLTRYDGEGTYYSPTISDDTWYTVKIEYSNSKMNYTVTERDTGAVIHEESNLDFRFAPFSYMAVGYYGAPDYGDSWAPIRVDNILIKKESSSTNSSTLSDGLVAHYEFEDDATDSSGNGNDGTESGGVSYVTGVVGNKAASFDGIDDYVALNSALDILGANPSAWSACIWVNYTESGAQQMLFTDYHSSGWDDHYGFGLALDASGYPATSMRYLDGSHVGYSLSGTSILVKSQWHQICSSSSKTSGILTLFVDGAKVTETSISTTANYLENTPMYIAATMFRNNIDSYYRGKIDDLRIYNRALSENEVNELYEMGQ